MPSYFIGTIYFLFVWLLLFVLNRHNRKEQIYFSILGACLGPLVQLFHLQDWWNPTFLFDTPIKIEDVLFGFTSAGVCAVIYEILTNKIEYTTKKKDHLTFFMLIVFGLIFFILPFYLFKLHSFWAAAIAIIPIGIIIAYKRRDLIPHMFMTSIIFMVVSIPFYLIPLSLDPNWITREWYLSNLSGILLIGIPLEEYVWYLLVGLVFSCAWEFKEGIRFKS